MLRYKNYIFFLLLIFSFNISSSQVIWRDSTGYIADTVYIDTTAFNLYGPFQYAKPTTASFLYLAPTYPNLSVPGWNNAIHNYQDKSFPYKSSPPYFNYNGVLYNPYDSRIFTDSLYGKLVGKLPENFLSEDVWIGAPVLNKPIYYRGSNGVGSVLKWKYAFFPYYKFPLYRNEDTVGVVFPDSLFFGGGVSDSSVVADVIKVNDTTLEIKRKAHIYNKGHYIRRTRLDSFLVSLSSSYYTYNNYYFDTTINNNYYNVDTNYYISNYYIDTNYYYTIYNIDTNIYIYQIDTNIYVTNNYYTANPDTFVTGIYAYMENDSLKIEITRSQGAPLLFTSVKLQINGMQKHGINDTTWHTGYPLNIWRGGTNYSDYQSNQNKLPSFLDYINEQIRPSNTFAADMYVDKGINFVWRTGTGSWRQYGTYGDNTNALRFVYESTPLGVMFQPTSDGTTIFTNRYSVVDNYFRVGGSMFSTDSSLTFANGYGKYLRYLNDGRLAGVGVAISDYDAVPNVQLIDSLSWRHGYTGTTTEVSSINLCDDTLYITQYDKLWYHGLLKDVNLKFIKVPTCKNYTPPPVKPPADTSFLGPEPIGGIPCNPSVAFKLYYKEGSIVVKRETYVDANEQTMDYITIIKNNYKLVLKNEAERYGYNGLPLGTPNTDTLYAILSLNSNYLTLSPGNRLKIAPGDSVILTIKATTEALNYSGIPMDYNHTHTYNSLLTIRSVGYIDYYAGLQKGTSCGEVTKSLNVPADINDLLTIERPPRNEYIPIAIQLGCDNPMVNENLVNFIPAMQDFSIELAGYNNVRLEFSNKLTFYRMEIYSENSSNPVIWIDKNGNVYDMANNYLGNKNNFDFRNYYDYSEGKYWLRTRIYNDKTKFIIPDTLMKWAPISIRTQYVPYTVDRKTIYSFTIPIFRVLENVSMQEYVRLLLNAKMQVYDVCSGSGSEGIPKISGDEGIGSSPPGTVHDTLWIADRFAQHNILDTSSHKGISLNNTNRKDLPIWLYDGNGFIKSDYTVNDIITSSADTVISIVDTNVIATKYYVDSKSNTADSSIFATRYWSDGLFLKKVDTTNKWQPKGNYASTDHSHSNYIQKSFAYADLMEFNFIGNQADQVAAGNHNHNGVYITPTDTTNKWQPKGNYASSDHQHTLTQIVGQGYNHNDIIKWDAYTSMWEVGQIPYHTHTVDAIIEDPDNNGFFAWFANGKLAVSEYKPESYILKSDSNVYYYRPWKIDNAISSRLPATNPVVIGTLNILNNGLEGTPNSELWTSYTDIGSYNPMLNTNARYITINGDTAATRNWVRENVATKNHIHDDDDIILSDPLAGEFLTTTQAGYIIGSGYSYNSFALNTHTHSVSNPLYWNNYTLSIYQANSTTSGYLSSTDWNTFNNKASTDWVSSNFSTLGHNHDGSYLSLAGGSLSGSLHAPYFYMNGNLVATQSWVSGNYSPTSHTHSGYATESWVNSNFSLNSHTHTTFNNLSVSTLSAYDHITSADYIQAIGGFRTYNNIGSSGTISKTFVTGVSLNKTKDYIEYKDWGGNNLQMEVVTDVSLNVSTATITLQFDGGLYISSSGWSGVYKEGEIHLTMDEFEKLKNNTWQIDPEYLEFLQWKQWKKEQENKVKLATEKK